MWRRERVGYAVTAVVMPFAIAAWLVSARADLRAAEQEWRLRGEFVALAPGRPGVAIIKLADGTRLEVPVAAISEADRRRVQESAAKPAGSAEDASREKLDAGADGGLPAAVKEVEELAASCRTAQDAVHVYRLFVAGGGLSEDETSAARQRLKHWRGLAAEGRVRGGEKWLTPAEAGSAAAEAKGLIAQAAEVLRLGNGKLAIEELQKAMRVDPVSGRAAFLLGSLAADPDKAIEFYGEAVERDPANGFALNNLAVCELLTRKSALAATHFRQAARCVPDAQVIADNVGLVVANANKSPRWKMADKAAADFAALYRSLTQESGLKAVDSAVGGLQIFGSDGTPRSIADKPATPEELAAMLAAPGRSFGIDEDVLGVVIAPGRVLAPVKDGSATISVGAPGASTMIPAKDVQHLKGTGFAIITVENLARDPLTVSPGEPAIGSELLVGSGIAGTSLSVTLAPAAGKVVSNAVKGVAKDAFVYTIEGMPTRGGGAILDRSGGLVGIVLATPDAATSAWSQTPSRGLGVPVAALLPSLEQQGISPSPPGKSAGLPAAELENRLEAATVVVSTRPPTPPPPVAPPADGGS